MQNHPNQNFAQNRTVSKANKCHKNILKLICSVGYHPIFQANLKTPFMKGIHGLLYFNT